MGAVKDKPNSASFNFMYSAMGQATSLALIYVVLLFLLPASKATMNAYHLSVLDYRIITLAIAVPSIVVWFAAFIGYVTLGQYAHYLRGTPEEEPYSHLATGCAWLAWSLPVTAIAALILNGIAYKWPPFEAASVIISNYLVLILPLIAFSIIGKASRRLVSEAKLKLSLFSARLIALVFLAAGVFYCYVTFSHFDLNHIGSAHNLYHLPVWLMVITIIIPYLYTWFIGLLATYEITLYSKQVGGVLYRNALRLLVAGLAIIIVSFIGLQYINSVSPRLGHLVLNYKLILTVIFHLINGAGFILLTIGALRLKRIEEV